MKNHSSVSNEVLLERIFLEANVGLMVLTGYRILMRANHRLAEMFGYASPEEMLGLSARAFHLSEANFVEFGQAHYEQLRLQEQLNIEYPLKRKDGQQLWCLLSGRALDTNYPADLSKGVLWTIDDISDVVAQREAEVGLSTLMDAIPDLIFFKDKGGNYVDCNQAFADFVGRPKEKIIGFNDFDFFDSTLAESCRNNDREMLRSGKALRNEEWVTYPDKSRVLLDTIKRPYAVAGEESAGVLGISRDITLQRWQAEDLDRAQRLAKIGSGYEDLLSGKSYWSENTFHVFGIDPLKNEPGPKAIMAQVYPEDRRKLAHFLTESHHSSHDHCEVEYRIAHPELGERWLYSRRELIRDEDGKPIRIEGIVQDITEQQLSRSALQDSEQRYRSIFESSAQGLLILDENGLILRANQSAATLLGYPTPDALVGAAPQDLSPPQQADGQDSNAKGLKFTQEGFEIGFKRFEWQHAHVNGQLIHVEVSLSRIMLADQPALLVAWYDLADKQRAQELEVQASAVLKNTAEGILITDADNRIISINPAFTELTGFTEADVLGKNPNILSSGKQGRAFYQTLWQTLQTDGRWHGEIWNRRKDGELYLQWLSISVIRDAGGRPYQYIGVFSDITEIRQAQLDLKYLSNFDVLTGLANAQLFSKRLQQHITLAAKEKRRFILLAISIDDLERVQLTHGQELADQMVDEFSQRLRHLAGQEKFLGRLEGQVFQWMLPFDDDVEQVTDQVSRIQAQLKIATQISDVGELALTASVGAALYPLDSDEAKALMRNSQSALQTAMRQGVEQRAFYRPEMTQQAERRLQLEQALRIGFANRDFTLFYQPKIDLQSGAFVGAEALIRWPKDGSVVSPGEFMPVIENSDLVIPVGKWVLNSAAEFVNAWIASGRSPIRVSVNISSAMIASGKLYESVAETLTSTGVDPACLEIEVLENVLLDDPETASIELLKVRDLGVCVALDDFGTGFSSLNYLKRFPFDYLKIDRSFISDIETNPNDVAIVRSTIAMAHNLGIAVVGEGVETEGQLRILSKLQCDYVQGYCTGRPLPSENFYTLFTADGTKPQHPVVKKVQAKQVLLVEDDQDQANVMKLEGEALGWFVSVESSAEAALQRLAKQTFDLVIADFRLPGMNGVDLLAEVLAQYPDTLRIITTLHHDEAIAIEAINRARVEKYIVKPWTLSHLDELVGSLWQH